MKSPETRRKPVQKRTKIVRDKTAFGKIFKQIRRLKTDAADGGKNPHFFPLFHTDTLAQRRRFEVSSPVKMTSKSLFSLLFFGVEIPKHQNRSDARTVFKYRRTDGVSG